MITIALTASHGRELVRVRDDATPLDVIRAVNRQSTWTAITVWGGVRLDPPGTWGRGVRMVWNERSL